MKNKYFLLLFFTSFLGVFAQDEKTEEVKQGWTTEGKLQVLFNQSAFNEEWTGGGTSSIAANFNLNYDLNYRRDDFSWSNRILATYGLTKTNGDEYLRKTSDRLEINSVAGKQIEESNWYYSFFANFRTQFAAGYDYTEDPDSGDIIRTESTNFLSPAYLQFGPGMMWKKSEDLYVNIAPATARFIFVDPAFTSTAGYTDGDYFGIDRGESSRFEFGASVSGYAKFSLVENVTLANTLNLYSNYLDEPGNVDIDYLMNLEMSINDFLSANLLFQAIYDDNAVAAFQMREVFGVGINYGF